MKTRLTKTDIATLLRYQKPILLKMIELDFGLVKGLSRKSKLELATLYHSKIEEKTEDIENTESNPHSKSDMVRTILGELELTGLNYTSGTVMKMLKAKHNLRIHRSFCCTIINGWIRDKE